MQTLIFNTRLKTVKVYFGSQISKIPIDDLLYEFENVPTVKFYEGFYEVMQEEGSIKYPVLRVPITNTNMVIEH